ncbi:unnamed protein product [Macrosiphum euphorbiae]|uniref:HAT C-terminal dimerisation domain-containing protein n=1 Tax=Macrosiphum euphorbiae TaxID=13131 RepID=A0AAV0XEJ1_9HEMI|nr:unnamed protein product [Macrosiphum euphorbiae]
MENENIKAECVLCNDDKKEYSGTLRSTSNFRLHIKRIHSNVLEEFENYIKSTVNERRGTKRKLNDSNPNMHKQQKLNLYFSDHQKNESKQKTFDTNILNYVVCSMKPLSTVEDEHFIKMIKDIDGTLKIFSRRTLSRRILENYTFICEKLKNVFESDPRPSVCTTADIWSTKHKSFMGVTAHWIDENTLTRLSCVLACRRFRGSHTYDKIAELLHEIICEFSIEREQLISTVTDNGSNFVKAFKDFGCVMDWNFQIDDLEFNDDRENADEEECTDDDVATFESIDVDDTMTQETEIFLPHHLRCASHTLSLIATTDFNKILKGTSASRINHSVMGKCTTLWNLSRRPKSSEIIHTILNCSLKYPCPTRWNSLYDGITQLLKYKDKLNLVLKELNVKYSFKDIDFEYLEELAALLKPIAGALDFLQSENQCYYGQLLPTLYSLKTRLEMLKEKNFRHLANMITPLVNSLIKRFSDFFELSPSINEAILATCFHPCYKLRWISNEYDHEKNRIQNLCINAAENIFNNDITNNSNSSDEDDDNFIVYSSQPEAKTIKKADLEVVTFFNDKAKSLNILNNYPIIKKLFIRFNSSLCSSAPVERMFSMAGFINNPTRNKLSDITFEKLVFLKGNKDKLTI